MQVQSLVAHKGDRVATIRREASVADAAEALRANSCGALVVSDDGSHVEGIISERDIVRRLASSGANVLNATVEDVMTSPVTTCGPSETIEALMALMTERRIRHVPVVVDEVMVGIVSIGDIVKHHVAHLENENQALHDYFTTGR